MPSSPDTFLYIHGRSQHTVHTAPTGRIFHTCLCMRPHCTRALLLVGVYKHRVSPDFTRRKQHTAHAPDDRVSGSGHLVLYNQHDKQRCATTDDTPRARWTRTQLSRSDACLVFEQGVDTRCCGQFYACSRTRVSLLHNLPKRQSRSWSGCELSRVYHERPGVLGDSGRRHRAMCACCGLLCVCKYRVVTGQFSSIDANIEPP